MNLDKNLIRQVRQAGWALTLTVLMGVAGGFLVLLQARRLSEIIARVFLGGQTLGQVASPLLGLVGIFVLRSLAVWLGEVAASLSAVRVKNNLRELLFRKLFDLGPAYTQGERSGELAAVAVQGVEALDAYFSQYLPQLALAAAVPLIILTTVFPIDLLSGVVLLLTAPLIPLFMVLIGSTAEALTRRQYTTLSRMSAFFLDTLQGLTTLKILGQSQKQAARIGKVSESYRAATMSVLRVTFLSAFALELLATLSTAIIAVQIGIRLLYGQVQFEEAFFILVIAPEFYLPLRLLGLRFHAGMSGVSAARRIFEILDTPVSNPVQAHLPATSVSPAIFQSLSFENVSFTYPNREGEALTEVSFTIHAGERVALVGQSGSGKSTIASLVLGFLQPQSGQILLHGQPLSTIPVEHWRGLVAWVPQQPYLFHDTLANNIRIANHRASYAEIVKAASQAGLDSFIQSLPLGYETIIGEQGSRLSGGQAQRLALARAFLKDAPFLILDEPTAHLDPESADQLRVSLRSLCAGRTVLMIAHSLPTVRDADRILVMEQGRVVEMGTHPELLDRSGAYAQLVRAYGGQA